MPSEKPGLSSASSSRLVSKIGVGFLVGIAVGAVGVRTLTKSYADGRTDALAEIRSRLAERGIYDPASAGETLSLSGVLESVDGSTVRLSTDPRSPDPLGPDLPATRIVTITDTTRIVVVTPKSPALLESELSAYRAALQGLAEEDGNASPEVMGEPSPYVEEEVGLEALEPGIALDVVSDHDILSEETFVATEIRITLLGGPGGGGGEEAPRQPGGSAEPAPSDDAVTPTSAEAPSDTGSPAPEPGIERPTQ